MNMRSTIIGITVERWLNQMKGMRESCEGRLWIAGRPRKSRESESKGMKQNETEENNHEKDLFTGRFGLRELRG